MTEIQSATGVASTEEPSYLQRSSDWQCRLSNRLVVIVPLFAVAYEKVFVGGAFADPFL